MLEENRRGSDSSSLWKADESFYSLAGWTQVHSFIWWAGGHKNSQDGMCQGVTCLGYGKEVGDGEALLGRSAGVVGTEKERRTLNSRIQILFCDNGEKNVFM